MGRPLFSVPPLLLISSVLSILLKQFGVIFSQIFGVKWVMPNLVKAVFELWFSWLLNSSIMELLVGSWFLVFIVERKGRTLQNDAVYLVDIACRAQSLIIFCILCQNDLVNKVNSYHPKI